MSKFVHSREVLITLFIVVILLIVSLLFTNITFFKPKHDLIGKEAPEISYLNPEKKSEKLSEKKGIVVLLYFWSIMCEKCMKELIELAQLELHFKNEGFVLLAFNISENENRITGEIKKGEYPKNLIFYFSKENLYSYGIKALPTAVLIDKKGIVKDVIIGGNDWLSAKSLMAIKNLLR